MPSDQHKGTSMPRRDFLKRSVVTAGAISATAAASEFQVDLSWSSTFPATGVSGFRVERNTSANGPWSALGMTANNVASYSDGTVAPSTTYYYRVVVVSTANTDLLASAPVAVTTPAPQLPLAPSGLTATASSTGGVQVILNWGECPGSPCVGDVNFDGQVNVDDLITVILNWGG